MGGSTKVWDAIRAEIAAIGRAQVRVGIIGAPASVPHGGSDVTNGEIALWMEYGTQHVPERSFIRRTLRDPAVLAEFRAIEERLVGAAIAGKMLRDRALGLLGAWMTSQIQTTITDDKVTPPLAPATIAAKHSDKVLVETGQLARSVSWEIVK